MRYNPRIQTISSPAELYSRVGDELKRVAEALGNPECDSVTLTELHAEPSKYWDGMIVFADGTDWNPGSGRGAYIRYASAWNKLG